MPLAPTAGLTVRQLAAPHCVCGTAPSPGAADYGIVVGQVASQQLPEPTTPEHSMASDFVEQCVTTAGHVVLAVHGVVPSSQNPFVHVPGWQVAQVTKPDFPHDDRAAQRVTVPLQFVGRPFATACFTACATQLTYRPWLVEASQTQVLAMLARTVAAMAGLEHFAAAVPAREIASSNAVAVALTLDVMSSSFLSGEERGGG